MTNYWPVNSRGVVPAEAQPEARRNRLLRRADWRFLAPNPRPGKSICFAGGELADAVGMISDEVIERGRDVQGECDLAVAVNASAAQLSQARSALRPGGTFYCEWYLPLAGGPPRLRRRLEAAGFADIACYWPWPLPNKASPLFWLPLEAPQALRYFLATRPPAPSIGLRLRSALLQPVWRIGLQARLLAPVCVMARRPAEAGSQLDNGLLCDMRANWEAWGLGAKPRRLSWLLMTGGRSSLNKVAGLVFTDMADRPAMIVKLPRLTESADGLRREAAILRGVHAGRPGGVAGVPRVVFFQDSEGQLALGETVLTGRPIFTVLRRGNFRDLALAVTDWLVELAGRAVPRPRAEWWPRLVEPALSDFESTFGPVVATSQLSQARSILAELGDLPLVPEQRDCSPWNVLLDNHGGLAVLDWESAEPSGLPALDLIYFLTYLAFFHDGAMANKRFGESYRAALDPTSFTGGILAACFQRYAAQTGIDVGMVRPLRLLAWLVHSRSEYRQMVSETGGLPTPATLRGSLFARLWAAEIEHWRNTTASPAAAEAV